MYTILIVLKYICNYKVLLDIRAQKSSCTHIVVELSDMVSGYRVGHKNGMKASVTAGS